MGGCGYEVGMPRKLDEELVEGQTNQRWMFQLMALFCAVFFSAGSHFSTYTINSLKSDLKLHMSLDNTQYGAAQAAMYLINTIMPLVGGIFMDGFGTAYGAVLSSSLVLGGSVLAAAATNFESFAMLVMGRVLHGLGSGVIVVAQETILGKWFAGSIIGTVIGLQIGASRLFSFIAQGVSLPFSRKMGYYGASLWLAVGVCFISFVATLLYALVLTRSGGEARPGRKGFSPRRLLYLPAGFWIMPFTILLLGGVWTPFLGSVTEFVKKRWGTKDEIAAWTGSVSLVVPVLLSPGIGGVIDRIGKRSIVVIISSVLCIASMALLGYSMMTPVFGLTLFSISLTIGPVALTSSVPLLLPPELVGTGIGAHKVGLSVGVALLHLVVGHVQDATPNHTYDNVIPLFLAVSSAALCMSFFYTIYSQRFLFGLFDAPISQRQEILEKASSEIPTNLTIEELNSGSFKNRVLVGLMVSLIVICWVTFVWSLLDSPAQYLKRFKLS
ncbi:hypothetical protein L0F63_002120 [Massospora cicadina]|nr:hypothetical protein L0F63_002120 [Massospora cicadina]